MNLSLLYLYFFIICLSIFLSISLYCTLFIFLIIYLSFILYYTFGYLFIYQENAPCDASFSLCTSLCLWGIAFHYKELAFCILFLLYLLLSSANKYKAKKEKSQESKLNNAKKGFSRHSLADTFICGGLYPREQDFITRSASGMKSALNFQKEIFTG